MSYAAPLKDMGFLLREISGLEEIACLPGYEEATPDLTQVILEEAGKVASDVLAPLNHSGDQEGSTFENGVVRTPQGFPAAYRLFIEGGWSGLPFDPNYGGQGLPWCLAMATQEIWQSANLSFGLAPLLTAGAVHLLQSHGSAQQKALYLPKLISGQWTGTMNLTEPQAGSDVGALKTKAEARGDHYLIRGQKIFISWGEHDCAENIVHMVLARTEGAPSGTKGISLFLVPKFLPDESGALGRRNDLRCVSLEHKLGINASPTAVMAYGDDEGAVGFLIGEECRGMAAMFTMMNNARLAVGVQGVAIAERAYQQALAYARERRQGRPLGAPEDVPSAAIIAHPDLRRQLMTMKAKTEAARALAFLASAVFDHASAATDDAARAAADRRFALLTPLVKTWCTEVGCQVADLGVQVHGGMGYVEETGAAQYFRDARILPIYEGTNGIQALDLLSRKLLRDRGAAVHELTAEIAATPGDLAGLAAPAGPALAAALQRALSDLKGATDWLLETGPREPALAAAGAGPYCSLFGTLLGGWMLTKSAIAAARLRESDGQDTAFLDAKIKTALFYAENILPQCRALAAVVTRGAESTLALDEAQF